MNRIVLILIVSAILILYGYAVSDSGPAITEPADAKKLVGVTMPTKTLTRLSSEIDSIKPGLEALGYRVDLQYADNEADIQCRQIEYQIQMGCDVLVIAPVDSNALGGVLKKAKEAGIPVIAYDRLLMGTDKCDYYVGFDSFAAGRMQGQYIADALGLDNGEKGPFTIECFAGDIEDSNSGLYYEGAMEVLQPYIDNGMLIVKSGQTGMNDITIQNWKSSEAQERMDGLLDKYYTEKNIDAVLSPSDSIAQGIVVSLKNHGYVTKNKPFPILTGQDCDRLSVAQIIRGEQSMSLFRDKRILMSHAIGMADALLSGREVPVNYVNNNGAIDVPSYNCEIKLVDAGNWREVLIDSGYYTEADIPME